LSNYHYTKEWQALYKKYRAAHRREEIIRTVLMVLAVAVGLYVLVVGVLAL
jgi:hypothetical protein